MSIAAAVEPRTGPFGQPRALYVLFFAEMWERFSFYGMRALLIFYLTRHFLFDDATATGIFATYGALVYLTPVLGGLVADRYLGFRKAVAFGAMLLCVGHFGMALEGDAARVVGDGVVRDERSLAVFYAALAFIIIGVGFLKASISSIVGALYAPGDRRRDPGFSIFYIGINLGASLAPFVCGYLGETYGWRYGFGLAGIGMLAGLVTFLRGRALLAGAGEPPQPARLVERIYGLSREAWIYAAGVASVAVAWALLQQRAFVGNLLTATAVLAVGGVVAFAVRALERVDRDRLLVVLYLTAVSVVFWSLFEQAGSSLNLFADRNVDRIVFGVTLRASLFQSLNPLFILLLAPCFSWLWNRLAATGREPSAPTKFGFGVLQVALGFAALVVGARFATDGIVALGWLVLAYLLHTTGELCLSPVGLSVVTRLSVPRVVGLMMGVWFLSSAFAQYVAGLIAATASVVRAPGSAVVASDSLAIYVATFGSIAKTGAVIGVVVLAVAPLVRRLMHDER